MAGSEGAERVVGSRTSRQAAATHLPWQLVLVVLLRGGELRVARAAKPRKRPPVAPTAAALRSRHACAGRRAMHMPPSVTGAGDDGVALVREAIARALVDEAPLGVVFARARKVGRFHLGRLDERQRPRRVHVLVVKHVLTLAVVVVVVALAALRARWIAPNVDAVHGLDGRAGDEEAVCVQAMRGRSVNLYAC